MLALFTVFKLIIATQEFENITIPWFKTKEAVIKLTDQSRDCTLCSSSVSTLKFCHEVDDNLTEIKDSFRTTVLKKEVKENEVLACDSCLKKVRIFTEIQSRKINFVFQYTGLENLWYILDTDGTESYFMGLELGQQTYLILLNKNKCTNTKTLIYLMELDGNNQVCLENDKVKMKKLLVLNNMAEYRFKAVPKGSVNIPKVIDVDQDILNELKIGASIITLKNVLIAVAVFYAVSIGLAMVYFNFVAAEKA